MTGTTSSRVTPTGGSRSSASCGSISNTSAASPAPPFQLMGVAPEPKSEAWEALTSRLGLKGAEVGKRVSTSPGAPPLAGIVEWAGQPAWPEELLLRLDEPAPGIAHLVPHPMGGQVYLTIRFYLYGDQAAAAVARAEPDVAGVDERAFPHRGGPRGGYSQLRIRPGRTGPGLLTAG